MYFAVGLGNPGGKYRNTRHNAGADFLVFWRKKNKEIFDDWKESKKMEAVISNGKILNKKIVLGLPQTFMNFSGSAVSKLANFYKIKSKNIIICYDDIDIPLGKYKISQNKSSGGHKGVESIINYLDFRDFLRIRIGINPKIDENGNSKLQVPAERFVLQTFTKEETDIIAEVFNEIACEFNNFFNR